MIDEEPTKEQILALFADVEPLEEGTKGLTFLQDLHQPESAVV